MPPLVAQLARLNPPPRTTRGSPPRLHQTSTLQEINNRHADFATRNFMPTTAGERRLEPKRVISKASSPRHGLSARPPPATIAPLGPLPESSVAQEATRRQLSPQEGPKFASRHLNEASEAEVKAFESQQFTNRRLRLAGMEQRLVAQTQTRQSQSTSRRQWLANMQEQERKTKGGKGGSVMGKQQPGGHGLAGASAGGGASACVDPATQNSLEASRVYAPRTLRFRSRPLEEDFGRGGGGGGGGGGDDDSVDSDDSAEVAAHDAKVAAHNAALLDRAQNPAPEQVHYSQIGVTLTVPEYSRLSDRGKALTLNVGPANSTYWSYATNGTPLSPVVVVATPLTHSSSRFDAPGGGGELPGSVLRVVLPHNLASLQVCTNMLVVPSYKLLQTVSPLKN